MTGLQLESLDAPHKPVAVARRGGGAFHQLPTRAGLPFLTTIKLIDPIIAQLQHSASVLQERNSVLYIIPLSFF